MKLRTEIMPSSGWRAGVAYTIECGYDTDHDAAAAHALLQAINNRIEAARDALDPVAARRIGGIINYADEIMREWGFGEDGND